MFAETGLGWVSSVLEACDNEWEKRHLWTEGIASRPSDLFRRQIYVDFWFESVGIQLREYIGVDNILWESDFPHITSTYPNSWDAVEHSLAGVPAVSGRKCYFAMQRGCIGWLKRMRESQLIAAVQNLQAVQIVLGRWIQTGKISRIVSQNSARTRPR